MERDFARNAEAYFSMLPRLVNEEQQGRFVVIRDTELARVFDSREAALAFAYAQYRREPFMVKQVLKSDLHRERDVDPGICHC